MLTLFAIVFTHDIERNIKEKCVSLSARFSSFPFSSLFLFSLPFPRVERKKRRSPTVRYYCETWIRYDGGGESPFVFPLARSNIPTMVVEEKKMEEEEKEEESSNADESCNTFAARNIAERITKVAGRALVMV